MKDNNNKRPKLDLDDFDKKLDAFGKKLSDKFNERIKSNNEQNKSLNKVVPPEENHEDHFVDMMMASKDLEEFEDSLENLELGKVDETDEDIVFFCKVCFDNNPPPPTEKLVTGCFTLDLKTFSAQKLTKPEHQPRAFRALKSNIKNHIVNIQHHKHKVEEKKRKQKIVLDTESRNRKVGLNLFRIRYSGIKHHQPRTSFEGDVLTAKLNGVDVGNINNSRFFAKDLDRAIFETMKDDLKNAMETELEATKERRPVGLLFDKMTPSKETGQIHALVIPVPENPLSQPLLVPVCLEVPPVTEHSVPALAKLAKSVLNGSGVDDKQLEGIAVDGEYVRKGIKEKLLELLDLPGMDEEDKAGWITCVWDPAHELELAMKDVRKDQVFDWLEKHIKLINEATELLNIGKGLQQSLRVAEELDEKLYKLRNMSSTRFVAYFYRCLENNEKSLSISIEVLKEKSTSSSKKETKEKAGRILKSWKTQQWMMINLGLIDIFRLMGMASKELQKVEIFPWDVLGIQESLISNLRTMADLKITDESGKEFENKLNEKLWPALNKDVENILRGEYKGQDTTVFQMYRRGRSGDDIKLSSLSVLKTVENRLSSLARIIASKLESRLAVEKDHQSSEIISLMGKCLNVEKIIAMGMTDEEFNDEGRASLKIVVGKAGYNMEEEEAVEEQYEVFKHRMYNLNQQDEVSSELIRTNNHVLYKLHECSLDCQAKTIKTCHDKGKVKFPKQPIPMKFLHLFLRKEELFSGIEQFLHLLLRCLLKTHAETVAESMGNLVDLHCEKRRGLGIEDVGRETFIDWNGPPVHHVESLGIKTLNRHFKGTKWHFVTVANKSDSEVTKKLKSKQPKLPFF